MEQSEKTLALLLVMSIIISIGGTVVSLNKLGQIHFKTLTGQATAESEGYVQLNVTSETSIAFTKTTINFGNGFVNMTCDNCTMWTNSSIAGLSSNYNESCCVLEWKNLDDAGRSTEAGLWVQNQGNLDLTINLNFSQNAANFIGGSSPDPEFKFMLREDNESKNCAPAGSCALVPSNDDEKSCGGNLQYTGSWYDVNLSNPVVCDAYNFEANSAKDEFVIDVYLAVPRTASASQKEATITITGTSV